MNSRENIEFSAMSVMDKLTTYHADFADLEMFELEVSVVLRSVKKNYPIFLDSVVYIIRAATLNPDFRVPRRIATKVGMGVFVVDEHLFTRIMTEQAEVLKYLDVVLNVDLFGTKLSCDVSCPMTRIFLGKVRSQKPKKTSARSATRTNVTKSSGAKRSK